MPSHREDPQGGQREQADQHAPGRAHGAVDSPDQHRRERADELLGRAPGCVVGGNAGSRRDADAVGEQQDQPRSQRGRPGARQAAQALEGGQRPPDAERREQHGPYADDLPQQGADPLPPAACDRESQQGEAEEQPDDQGADADQFLAGLPVHVMRRSA